MNMQITILQHFKQFQTDFAVNHDLETIVTPIKVHEFI